MATRKLDQSQLELQAAESGNRAAQAAHDARQNREQRNLDRAERAREFDEQINQRELDRWNQQWQERRRARDQRASDLAERQAGKQRTTNFGTEGIGPDEPGGRGYQEPAPAGDPRLEEQKRQFDIRTQMQAADKGLEQTGQGIPGGAPGPDNPRLQALQQQNAAATARGDQQMAQGLEQDPQGKGFVKSASRIEQEKQAQELPRERALTARMNALERHRQNVRQYKLATAKFYAPTTAAGKKEAKAEMEAKNKQLFQPIESTSKLIDRLRSEKAGGDDWAALREMVKNDPKAGVHAETIQEIDDNEFGENLGRFLNEKIGAQGVKYAFETGQMPDGTKVPYYTAGMQLLTKNTVAARTQLSTGANALILKKRLGEEQFNRLVTELAGEFTMKGQDLQQVMLDAGLTDEDVKNSAQRERPAPMMEHRGTGQAAERGQVTPAGAAAKGGTDFTGQPYPGLEPIPRETQYPAADQREPDPFGRW